MTAGSDTRVLVQRAESQENSIWLVKQVSIDMGTTIRTETPPLPRRRCVLSYVLLPFNDTETVASDDGARAVNGAVDLPARMTVAVFECL